ncbi:MAG: hypothetical protein ISS18_04880 [Bacteroidales bacterium]|nr:hypothetical protein [Actinomycetota bacterium]MBL7103644.1 hypothetical protein [Bacteroidales bacterium]
MSKYEEFREKWKHEDGLINQRLTWLLITQTLLFAGYANIFVKIMEAESITIITHFLLLVMAIFGILFSNIIRISVNAAIMAMYDLKKQYKEEGNIDTSERATDKGFKASKNMPKLFIILWILLLLFQLQELLLQIIC